MTINVVEQKGDGWVLDVSGKYGTPVRVFRQGTQSQAISAARKIEEQLYLKQKRRRKKL